jgi:hypothetical protein
MLSRHMGGSEEADFTLYADPTQNVYLQHQPYHGLPNFDLDNNGLYHFARAQAQANVPFTATSGFSSNTVYAEADASVSSYALESPELRAGASSNYSTASGASAASSAIGSPPSVQGHVASVPEWATSSLGPNHPNIVRFDSFSHNGNEYNFPPSGMEEFALEFDPAKPDDFVGKCKNISRVACNGQPGATPSNPKSLSLSTVVSSPTAMIESAGHFTSPSPSMSILSSTPPLSARSRGPHDDYFPSPVSALPLSPTSFRRPSQAFKRPSFASSSTAGRAQDVQSSPRSGVSQASFISESPSSPFFSQSSGSFVLPLESTCWFPLSTSAAPRPHKRELLTNFHSLDPSILHPQYAGRPSSATQSSEVYHAQAYPESPALSNLSQLSRSPRPARQGSQSPYLNSHYAAYPYPPPRRQSIQSYSSQENFSSEESREKGRCTYPDCGKVFKDLKAHMLTHQNERPEKCPIQTCEYHIKGFARKYDKNRHTLTHYKGTMVCGFCPGSGSSHEKSFNRADVFKRHLTSVHAVEQTPPNSRKKTATNNGGRNLPGYVSETSGKCSTCSATFSSAQDFYEHLDDCVLRIVQQEEPSEAVNAARLAEVEQDADVHETLRNNALPTTTTKVYFGEEEDEDDDMDDDNDDDFSLTTKLPRKTRNNRTTNGGIQKSRGLTHSKGGVTTVVAKGRKRRKDYPQSWGCAASQMKMKKRVLCVFDGSRRLWKDDMMIDTSGGETRVSLPDGKSYVTDLDVMTVRRADAFHNASEDEKGPWIADDLTGLDVEKLLEVKTEP